MSADVSTAALARLAVAVVLHDDEELSRFAGAHPGAGASRRVHESLLQCHLFCGFPRTLAALDTLRAAGLRLEPTAADDGVSDDGVSDGGVSDAGAAVERGADLFDAIYGDGAEDVRVHLASLSPTFAEWIADHAYGRVLSRDGMPAAERELLAVAMLAATGHDRQLASHARGAVRCGATREGVLDVIEAVADQITPKLRERAREVASRFAR